MRTYPAAFTAVMPAVSSAPYGILEINWGTTASPNVKYYLDRATTEFSATGTRHPATIQTPKVLSWGAVGLTMRENAVGGVDRTSVVLEDVGNHLKALLNAGATQRKQVKIWRMFDVASVAWSAGAALIFSGGLKPFAWKEGDNHINLEIEDASRKLLKDVSHPARIAVFEDIPAEYEDRHLPVVMGRADRVEAILVSAPWSTKTLVATPSGTGAVTVDIDDHPDDIGIPTGVAIDIFFGDDPMTATFTQSSDPANVPSTVSLTAVDNVIATGSLGHVQGTGASRFGVIFPQHVNPVAYRDTLHTVCPNGTDVLLYLQSSAGPPPPPGWNSSTTTTMNHDDPWSGAYKVTFSGTSVNASLSVGDIVKFLDSDAGRRSYPPGTLIRPQDAQHIYIANSLPSKAVHKVEGFGDLEDEAGDGRKDFIILGQLVQDGMDGSVEIIDQVVDPFTINLNDDTWNLGTGAANDLGRNVTTITFSQAPRLVNSNLEDNRLWVSLKGVEDVGDSSGAVIENPALVILEYLDNPSLLGVDAAFIDTASFTAAATSLAALKCGFAQIEPQPGLDYLQQIASQAHSILLFDQGKVSIAVLSNSAGTNRLTLVSPGGVDNIQERSFGYQESDVDQIVTELVGRWRKAWDDKTGNKLIDVKRINATAEETFGRRTQNWEMWIYRERGYVESELDFQLARLSRVYRHVKLTTYMDALALQPADWVRVSFTDGEGNVILATQDCEVQGVSDRGPSAGLVDLDVRYAQFSY